ncbi:MAG: nitroreductase [Bacteroidales bacterium]|nr:nitroreductase [Bacteroidales bacterium]
MTMQEAIFARHSVRQYTDQPIESDKITLLRECIDTYNQQANLHIQLVTDEPQAFGSGMAKYGKFSGVKNYIALIARRGADEAIGYYGEQLVLMAQTLGLNSCWVGLTFSKQPDHYQVAADEKLYCVIALGYGITQGVPHPQKKGIEAYCRDQRSVPDALPQWFIDGMQAALLAPTAINQQKFEFILFGNGIVEAKSRFTMVGYAKIELGIAKCHFELAASKDNFAWK